MKLLEEKILKDGRLPGGGILKVDNFLNHQMDIELFCQMGQEFARLFAHKQVTKILTVEASGIGVACIAAQYFGNVPVVFAKKTSLFITKARNCFRIDRLVNRCRGFCLRVRTRRVEFP